MGLKSNLHIWPPNFSIMAVLIHRNKFFCTNQFLSCQFQSFLKKIVTKLPKHIFHLFIFIFIIYYLFIYLHIYIYPLIKQLKGKMGCYTRAQNVKNGDQGLLGVEKEVMEAEGVKNIVITSHIQGLIPEKLGC